MSKTVEIILGITGTFLSALFVFLGGFVLQKEMTKRRINKNNHETLRELIKNKTFDKETTQKIAKEIIFSEKKIKKIKQTEEYVTCLRLIFKELDVKRVISKIKKIKLKGKLNQSEEDDIKKETIKHKTGENDDK